MSPKKSRPGRKLPKKRNTRKHKETKTKPGYSLDEPPPQPPPVLVDPQEPQLFSIKPWDEQIISLLRLQTPDLLSEVLNTHEGRKATVLQEHPELKEISYSGSNTTEDLNAEQKAALTWLKEVNQRIGLLKSAIGQKQPASSGDQQEEVELDRGPTVPQHETAEIGYPVEQQSKIPPDWKDLPFVSQNVAAELIGVKDARTVRHHLEKGHLKKTKSGRVTTESIQAFLRDFR